MIYLEVKQLETVNNIFEKIYNAWVNYGQRYEDIHIVTLEFIASTMGYFDLFKDPLFAEEDEYRIIVTLLDFDKKGSQDIIKYKPKNGVIIPYIEIPIKTDDGISPIELIRIGPKNNIDVAEEGIRLFLGSKKNNNKIEVVRSEMTLRF